MNGENRPVALDTHVPVPVIKSCCFTLRRWAAMDPTPMMPRPSSLQIRRHPVLLACFLALIAVGAGLASSQAEVRTTNLWWAPNAVTEGGHKVDELLTFIFNLTGITFLVLQVVYIYFLIKYRRRPGVRAVYSHGDNRLEAIWTLIPAAVFLGLAAYSNHLWKMLRSPAPEDAVRIDIVAHQYGWFIRNPGLDGKLGGFDQKLLSKENTFGTEVGDPAGADDYSSGELTIPMGKAVNVILRSQDVIHAFYVPEFRMYQDAVPGRKIDWVWFKCDRVGQYELACSQLCGSGHYNMKARINVVSPENYEKTVREKSKTALEEKAKTAAEAAKLTPEMAMMQTPR